MIKTPEDVNTMIDIIEHVKISLQNFGFWVLRSLSTPVPGVIYVDSTDNDASSV